MTPAAAPGDPRIAVPARLGAAVLDAFDPDAAVADFGGATMGTWWRVRLALPAGRAVDPLRAAVQARLDGLVAQLSHWDAGSDLSRYNAASAGSWLDLPPDFAAVVAGALDIAAQSGGAFDPAIGRLTDLWSLGPNRHAAAPDVGAIADALALSGWDRIAFDGDPPRLHQPGGLWLDLSGIAKGYAADILADLLGEMGLRHVLVEVGGEYAGRGIRPDGDPWWVELETPPALPLPPFRIALHQLAVATSGDYLRGAHAIVPSTGLPAFHTSVSVSVVHASGMAADGWASALGVLEANAARAMAERERLAVRLIGRDGSEWLSPALAAML